MSDNSQIPSNAEPSPHLFKGPANWFTMNVPGDLEIEQTEAFLEVRPVVEPTASSVSADGDSVVLPSPWSMTLYAAWVDDSEPETRAASFDPANLFPQVVSSEHVTPLKLPGKCNTWAGTSTQPTSGGWWNWLVGKRRPYAWRLWVIEYQDIMVVASLQGKSGVELTQDTVAICESLLNSLEFADVLAKPPELFRGEVIAIANKYFPLLTTQPAGNFSVKIGDSEVNLANFYRSYIHEPEQLSQIVLPSLTTVVRLQEWGPDQLMPPLDDIADRIMPMLYPESDADSNLADFVQVPWVGGLTIMFVLDEDSTYRFVHKKMVEKWQLPLEDLEELAMENLELYARDNPLEVTLIGEGDDPRMLVPVQPNAYNSVRLLGDHLHSRLRQMLGAELVVGVPNRDFFVAVSLKHPQLVGQVRQRVIEDYQAMHHPLTQRLLVISADGVSEYCED